MPVSEKAQATKEFQVAAETRLYWFGMLPAPGEFPYEFPTRDRQEDGTYVQIKNTTAAKLWELSARVWSGKCRFFQSLPVKGFNFPAFSEVVERQATVDDEVTRSAYPGALKIMRGHEAKAIISSAWRNVVRYGRGKDDIMSLRNAANGGISPVQVLDLGANDERPPGMTAEEFAAKRIVMPEDLSFDPYRDIPVAEFVYFVPIDCNIREVVDAKGILDPGEAVSRLPHQRLNARFFSDPPKSLAEMYPQSRG